jgi:hypothetical protein
VTANGYRLTSANFTVAPGAGTTGGDPNHPAAVFAPITRR